MYIERIVLTLAVDASGNATVYSPSRVSGSVLQLVYVPDGSTPLDTNADITITGEESGVAIATIANIGTVAFTKAIRQASHAVDGSAALFAAGGAAVGAPVVVAGERIKVAVVQGGVSKTGTLHLFIG